jgi:hypothetical protein
VEVVVEVVAKSAAKAVVKSVAEGAVAPSAWLAPGEPLTPVRMAYLRRGQNASGGYYRHRTESMRTS